MGSNVIKTGCFHESNDSPMMSNFRFGYQQHLPLNGSIIIVHKNGKNESCQVSVCVCEWFMMCGEEVAVSRVQRSSSDKQTKAPVTRQRFFLLLSFKNIFYFRTYANAMCAERKSGGGGERNIECLFKVRVRYRFFEIFQLFLIKAKWMIDSAYGAHNAPRTLYFTLHNLDSWLEIRSICTNHFRFVLHRIQTSEAFHLKYAYITLDRA